MSIPEPVVELEVEVADETEPALVEEEKVYVAKKWGAPSDPYVSYNGEVP